MSEGEKVTFLCTWKIKRYNLWIKKKESTRVIFCPSFVFCDRKWDLYVTYQKRNVREDIVLGWVLDENRKEYDKFYHFRYELVSPEGIVLRASDFQQYQGILMKSNLIAANELEKEMMSWGLEDTLTIRCYIECKQEAMKLTSNEALITACEIETNIYSCNSSVELLFKFAKFRDWSANRTIDIGCTLVDINLSYVDDNLEIKLLLKGEEEWEHYLVFKLKLIDANCSEISSKKLYNIICNKKKENQVIEFNFKKQHLEKAGCFKSQTIKLHMCVLREHSSKINYFQESVINESSINLTNEDSSTIKLCKSSEADCLSCLQNQLQSMFLDKIYADVKLRADDEIFSAHKCLLSARSPVLRAMFDLDMSESKTGTIDIQDVEAETLKLFLEYLYTGSVDGMDDGIALSLLVVADKYQVLQLMEKCSIFLKSVLCFSNVLNILSVADMVHQEKLKICAIEYIAENSTKVLSSPEWSQWMKKNGTLASDVFLQLSTKLDAKPSIL